MGNLFVHAMKVVEEARKETPVKFSISIEADENTKLQDVGAQIEIQGPANALCAMAAGAIVSTLATNASELIKQENYTQKEAEYLWSAMDADMMKYMHAIFAMEAQNLGVKLHCNVKLIKITPFA